MFWFVWLWALITVAHGQSLKVMAPYSAVANTNIVFLVLKEADLTPSPCEVVIRGNGLTLIYENSFLKTNTPITFKLPMEFDYITIIATLLADRTITGQAEVKISGTGAGPNGSFLKHKHTHNDVETEVQLSGTSRVDLTALAGAADNYKKFRSTLLKKRFNNLA